MVKLENGDYCNLEGEHRIGDLYGRDLKPTTKVFF